MIQKTKVWVIGIYLMLKRLQMKKKKQLLTKQDIQAEKKSICHCSMNLKYFLIQIDWYYYFVAKVMPTARVSLFQEHYKSAPNVHQIALHKLGSNYLSSISNGQILNNRELGNYPFYLWNIDKCPFGCHGIAQTDLPFSQ